MFKYLPSIVAAAASLLFASASLAGGPQVKISQVYGGGGNSNAPFNQDFVEIFNAGATPADISDWSVQYTSSSGDSWGNQLTTIASGVVLQPGQYYLVGGASGGDGVALPDVDLAGGTNLSSTHGKIALVSNSTALTGDCPVSTSIVDFVGYGDDPNCFEGAGPTGDLPSGNQSAALRGDFGCADTDDNAADFSIGTPAPRNSASPVHSCTGGAAALLIADVSQVEGNGAGQMVFIVSLSQPAPAGGVTFDIATSDGSATAGTDYTAAALTGQTIAEGNTSYQFQVAITGDALAEPDEVFSVLVSNVSGVVIGDGDASGTILNDDVLAAEVFEIQGSGAASPLIGQSVRLTDNLVTAAAADGFVVQTPDARDDGDEMTSNGVYVYTGSAPTVQLGDLVSFDATVQEFFGVTELGSITNLVVVSSGNALPAAVAFDGLTPSRDPNALSCGTSNFECFEGMRVAISNGMVTRANQNFGSDPYAEVVITTHGERSLREPGLLPGIAPVAGDNDAAGIWDGNPEVFEMDLDRLLAAWANTPVTAGSTFTATGVIGFEFGDYEFWPLDFSFNYQAQIPNGAPLSGAEVLRIGDYNVLRLCDDINDVGSGSQYECGDNGLPTAQEYAQKLARLSQYIGVMLGLPDVVALEEVEKVEALQALATQIQSDFGVSYDAYLVAGNDPGGIDVAFLVNSSRVTVNGVSQLAAAETWLDPGSGTSDLLHDRPPLLLDATFTGGGFNQRFLVMVQHLKSRSNVEDGDAGAARDNEKRLRQAVSVAHLIQDIQTAPATTGVPLLVVGDFNSYQFSDGFVDMVGMISGNYDFAANLYDPEDFTGLGSNANIVVPPLWNAVDSLPRNQRYSYLYTQAVGSRDVPANQVIDHALLNTSAQALFSRMDYARANVDAADEVEETSSGVIGSSDHEGFVVQLVFDRIFADGFEGID